MKLKTYERPEVDIFLSTVELGFALSSQIEVVEGDEDDEINW